VASNAHVVVVIDSRDEIERLPDLPHIMRVSLDEPAGQLRDLELYKLSLRSEDDRMVRDDSLLRARLAATMLQSRFSTGGMVYSTAGGSVTSPQARLAPCCVGRSVGQIGSTRNSSRAAASHYRDQLKAMRVTHDPSDLTIASGAEVQVDSLDLLLPGLEEVMTAIRKGDTQSPVFDRFQHVEPRGFNATVLLRAS
jgi:hypothetical protein